MRKTATEINKLCPILVDSETRLENTIVLPSNVFQYNYTLMNIEKGSIDIALLKNEMEPDITNFVCTSPDMKVLRDNKVTINFQYSDKDGNHLFTISVASKLYG